MASSLDAFLTVKDVELEEQTLAVKAKDGTELEVDIRALTLSRFKNIKSRSTQAYTSVNNGAPVAQVEEVDFALRLAAAGIVRPSLNTSALRQKFHATSNEEVVEGLFPSSEIFKIGAAVSALTLNNDEATEQLNLDSGVDEELLEEAKN